VSCKLQQRRVILQSHDSSEKGIASTYIHYYLVDSCFKLYDINGGFHHRVWEFRVINCEVFFWGGGGACAVQGGTPAGFLVPGRFPGNIFKAGDVKRTQGSIKTSKNSVISIAFLNKGNSTSTAEY
jgi:hypothetical protein